MKNAWAKNKRGRGIFVLVFAPVMGLSLGAFGATPTPTLTATPTVTLLFTFSPTKTFTPLPGTDTFTPTLTPTPTDTFPVTFTPTLTSTATVQTSTPTPTKTFTPLPGTNTPTPTLTFTFTLSPTPSVTLTPTPTLVSSCCQGVGDLTGLTGHPLNGSGMVVDYANHRLYVADFTGDDIQVFNSDTNNPVTVFSALAAGHLINPVDAALDADGNLYVADEGNQAVQKFDSNFNFVCSIGIGSGFGVVGVWADKTSVYFSTTQNFIYEFAGSGTSYAMAASFGGPSELSHPNEMVKVGNELYAADTFNGRVVKFDTTNPSAAPVVVQASLFFPTGLRVDLAGNFYVGESDNGGVAQFVDRFDTTFNTEESQCPLHDVWGPAVNASGEVFVSGLNSFAVTELAGCVTEPILTPTPSYLGPNPPVSGSCFIYPSPAPKGGQAHVVYDMTGSGRMKMTIWSEAAEKVADVTDTKPAGTQSTPFSLAKFAPGVYFYSVTLSYDSGSVQKIPVQKFAISP